MVLNQDISASGNIDASNFKKHPVTKHLKCVLEYNKHILKCIVEFTRNKNDLTVPK